MDSSNRAIAIVLAAGEGDLELAWQVVKIGMAQEIPRYAQCVRRHVKRFPRADSGHRAGRNVAHSVTASLARGKPRMGEQAHGGAHVFKFHEMKLNVFSRSEVAPSRRVLVRNLRQHAKLRGLEHARSDLDAQHLEARLPLAVRAVLQAKRAKLFRSEGAALQLLSLFFKTHDLRFDGFPCVPFFNFG